MGKHIDVLVKKYPQLSQIRQDIEAAASILINGFESGGKLLLCGNGGSAADCEHIAGELLKGYRKKRPLDKRDFDILGDKLSSLLQYGLPAIPLVSHSSVITAVINDLDSGVIFAQQVMALGKDGDVLIGISTSGNAINVINAIYTAKCKGMRVISLTGSAASKMSELSDVAICVPAQETPDVQELHLPVYHTICAEVEEYFFEV